MRILPRLQTFFLVAVVLFLPSGQGGTCRDPVGSLAAAGAELTRLQPLRAVKVRLERPPLVIPSLPAMAGRARDLLFPPFWVAASPSAQYYDFHNNFWMNLHHTLFREMVVGKMDEQMKKKIGLVPLSDAALSQPEKQIWSAAVHFYAITFAKSRLLFDEMVPINNLLGQQKDLQKLSPSGLSEDLAKCLESAAPVYRSHWWPDHRKANEQFIAEMRPKADEFGPLVIPQLERFFGMKWQSQPLQVDVAYYVAEVGSAYTTEHPGHSTIASSREDNHGLAGVETIFHEGAHTLTDNLESALDNECKRQNKRCDDLWHAVQFYTVGIVVKEALAAHGNPGYIPYADKFGLYERGDWPKFRPALGRDWQPYLDGKSPFDQAVANLVRDISATAPQAPPSAPNGDVFLFVPPVLSSPLDWFPACGTD